MKLPYAQLSVQVNKLYDYKLTDEKAIEEHCEYIRQFIEACGWDVDDYIRAMMQDGPDFSN